MTTLFISPCHNWSHMSRKICMSRADKFRIALEARSNGSSVDDACRVSGISRSSYFRWQNMLKNHCESNRLEESLDCALEHLDEALAPRSKRPKNLARKISQIKRDEIVQEAKSGRHNSGLSVTNALR